MSCLRACSRQQWNFNIVYARFRPALLGRRPYCTSIHPSVHPSIHPSKLEIGHARDTCIFLKGSKAKFLLTSALLAWSVLSVCVSAWLLRDRLCHLVVARPLHALKKDLSSPCIRHIRCAEARQARRDNGMRPENKHKKNFCQLSGPEKSRLPLKMLGERRSSQQSLFDSRGPHV